MSQAFLRGMIDQSGEQFVAYFLPTEETLAKRRRDDKNEVEYEDIDELVDLIDFILSIFCL